ncbi:MAG: hypothetical protein JO287_01890 [Pseudonocardiales bacterium]|nr:hypothetical protein [Pseudonocardiales bacterium]
MSPANVEARLKASTPLIGQAVCIGDARPYNVALLMLDPDAAAAFTDSHRLPDTALRALCGDRRVLEDVAAGGRSGQRAALTARADPALDPAGRPVAARWRRAHPDDETPTPPHHGQVCRRH